MSQMKDIARGLSANGAAAGPTTKGHYLLYTDTGKLVVKLWTGETFSDEQLVSSSVRRGSTAGYVTLASNKSLAVAITSDSKLAVFQYDEEEEEWTQDSTLPAVAVHPSGKLAATLWQERVLVVVQAAGGELLHLSKPASGGAWASSQLTTAVTPLAGTALSFSHPGGDVFYVSGADQKIHGLYESESWADSVLAGAQVAALTQVFVVSGGTKETVEAYGLTPENAVLHIPAGGEKVVLGDIQADGSFAAKVKAEYCNTNTNTTCVIA
ncbi:hypothetical protein FOMPIDRAFT_1039771 [Fomitopsis schrenkii]|uniref:Fucose-specific lectin n=1 Tax=Fomitopsis schrenkii TaxID=2126942 RepID=S8EI59_FOMSC|nr:hypothetical protein FOMPIDRAFT_1039771 [Fomitopsis schrenkii]